MSKLVILEHNQDYVVCIKPVGLSSEHNDQGSGLPDMLADKLGVGPSSIYTVHRLDRTTGGVMVYACSSGAAAYLSQAVAQREAHKTYLAVAHLSDNCFPESGTWEDLLFFDRTRNKSYIVARMRKGVKTAILDYRLLETTMDRNLGLFAFDLHTGRTHQIRIQAASRGLPLFGDRKYGAPENGTPALWSFRLTFPDPRTGKTVTFTANPPETHPFTLFANQTDCQE